ncbi:Hsp70-Hsp90 organizing protein 2 [Diplonema papillatum]|nr:Hsp70-Hsp90 organizing protein 2 [Diplonema papillatum]
MTSREDFLASLGLTETDVADAGGEERRQQSPVRTRRASDWASIRASETGGFAASPAAQEGLAPAAFSAEGIPQGFFGKPSYGRRSPNSTAAAAAATGADSPILSAVDCPPPQYAHAAAPPLFSGSCSKQEAFDAPVHQPSARTPGKQAKAGRRSEAPLDPSLQAEVDSAGLATPAAQLKDLGNRCFHAKCFSAAIRVYTLAIDKLPSDAVLYSNRSAAYLQSSMVSGAVLALQDAEKCVELDGRWFKGWSRRGDALFKLKKFGLAAESYRKSCELSPGSENAKASLAQCEKEEEAERREKRGKDSALRRVFSDGAQQQHDKACCEDVAAVGRSFREVELMRYRNRRNETSRPSSRADDMSTASSCFTAGSFSDASHASQSSSPYSSEVARAYKDSLLSCYRARHPGCGDLPDPDQAKYRPTKLRNVVSTPADNAISAESYDLLVGQRRAGL